MNYMPLQAIACKPEPILPAINVATIVRKCRLRVAEEYHRGGGASAAGDAFALKAIACSSVVLEGYIAAGSLVPSALGQLRDVADNLGMTDRLGSEIVDICIGVGAALYQDLADAWDRRAEMARAA